MNVIDINLGANGITPSSTFNGGNISPQILLSGVPKDLQYVSVIVQNKSGDEKNKCIWVIWNIPSIGHIAPGYDEGPTPQFPFPAVQGVNDFGEHMWHGPSPGLGVRDKLLIQVFGRNERLVLSPDSTMDDVIVALRDGKTIAYGSLEYFYHG